MIKKRLIALTLIATLSFESVALASTLVVGYKSINNNSDSDFKTTEHDLKKVASNIGSSNSFNEILNYDSTKALPNNSVLSYMEENDLLGDDLSITFDNGKVSTSEFPSINPSVPVKRSDFLVALSKSVFGVQKSRPIVFKTNPTRLINGKEIDVYSSNDYKPYGYQGSDNEFDFSRGDNHVYISPNVYEMYFKTLIDKGIISLKDFSNVAMVEDLSKFGATSSGSKSYPVWHNGLEEFKVNGANPSQYDVYGENPLGQFFKYSKSKDGVSISKSDVSWMFNEKILTIDALKYVESCLRISEKDMTESEAKIINFKYGANYLYNLDDANSKTIMFLIAKGVLNFEDESEFNVMYRELDYNLMAKVLYRVHNKDARLDFSKVQLTDSDNFWLTKGFRESKLKVYFGETPKTETYVSEVKSQASSGFIKPRPVVIADGPKTYKVTRIYYKTTTIDYIYKGKKLPNWDLDDTVVKIDNTTNNAYTVVEYNVVATSEKAALGIIDVNATMTYRDKPTQAALPAYSKIGESGEEQYYVSQSAFGVLDYDPIQIVSDKYLVNTDTGAKALLLEDNKVAIIGNEIIRSDEDMVYSANNEVHYNLNIIKKLLSDKMMDQIAPSSIFLTAGRVGNEEQYTIKATNGADLGKTYVSTFNVVPYVNAPSAPKKDVSFYNITQTSSTNNFVIFNIKDDIGSDKDQYMVMELRYSLPSSVDGVVEKSQYDEFLNGGLSMATVFDNMYKEPKAGSPLRKWWDSNLTFTNAMMNYMMGTKGKPYISSGYLAPSIYVLSESGGATQEDLMKLFTEKLKLTNDFTSSHIIGNNDFIKSYFTVDGTSISSNDAVYDSVKGIRKFQIYKMRPGSSGNFKDYSEFITTGSDQVYRDISNNGQFKVDDRAKTITTASRKYNLSKFVVGSYYKLEQKDGKVIEFSCSQLDSNGIATFVSNVPYEAVIKDGKVTCIDPDTKEERTVEDQITHFNANGYKWPITEGLVTDKDRQGENVVYKTTIKDVVGYYYSEDKVWFYKGGGENMTEVDYKSGKEGIKVNYFPQINLNVQDFKVDDNNNLMKEPNFAMLDVSNVTNFGVTSQIIDSIAYANSGVVSQSQLKRSSKVIIGDISFNVKDGYLVSPVLKNKTIVADFQGANMATEDKIKAISARTIGSIPVTLSRVGAFSKDIHQVNLDNNNGNGPAHKALADYLVNVKLGIPIDNKVENGTLYGKNNVSVYGSNEMYQPGARFESYCIAIKFDEAVKFRPLNADSSSYTLLTVVNENGPGFLQKIPYFTETLNLFDNEGLYTSLTKSKFEKSKFANEFIEGFRDLYMLKKQQDFLGLIKYWIRLLVSILCITNLLVVLIKRTMIDIVIRDIRNPGGDKQGPDIYKWFTLGFQDAESDSSLLHAIGLSLMFFAVAVFVSI